MVPKTLIAMIAAGSTAVVTSLSVFFYPFGGIQIEGLRSNYAVGEEVGFIIKVKDFDPCQRPSLAVRSTESLEVVWVSRLGISASCIQLPHEANVSIRPADIGDGPIIINEAGTYELALSYGNETLRRTFQVSG
jgi:hypothetical protein